MKNQVKYVYGVAALVVAYLVWKGLKTGKGVAAEISNAVTAGAGSIATAGTGINLAKITDICERIYTAIYKNDYFGWTEDEAALIAALNELSNINEAKAAKVVYQNNYKKSLSADVQKALSTSDRNKVKTFILNSIK